MQEPMDRMASSAGRPVGYCGDDYSGEQFIRMDDGTYLCIPFEF